MHCFVPVFHKILVNCIEVCGYYMTNVEKFKRVEYLTRNDKCANLV